MKLFFVLTVAILLTTAQCTTTPTRPRGVSITNKVFYDSSVDFTCLDGSKTIPFSYVNDDYCDCPDGSDEPGTSACPNGKFHCTNAGFKPKSIPASRVNDGICDCCDGSDEWKFPKACPNVCVSLYKEQQQQREMEMRALNQGNLMRQEYAQIGTKVKAERQEQLKEAEEKLSKVAEDEAEALKQKQEIELRETELKDKHDEAAAEVKRLEEEKQSRINSNSAFAEMDLNHDGILTIPEIILHKELDPDTADNDFTEVEAAAILMENLVGEEKFYLNVWPTIKGAFKSSLDVEMPPPPPVNNDLDSKVEPTPESDVAEIPTTESEVDEEAIGDDDDYEEEEEDDELDEEVATEAPPPQKEENQVDYDQETLEVIMQADEKRKIHGEVLKTKKDLESEIDRLKKKMQFDYGTDNSYQVLEGKCFELKTLEYKYSFCPFDKTTQAPLHGGSSTSLGKWGRWSGPSEDKYSKMKFEHGLGCWNGPSRSTEVVLSCGTENKLISVDEPSRCSYLFEFTTPCACFVAHNDPHDEL